MGVYHLFALLRAFHLQRCFLPLGHLGVGLTEPSFSTRRALRQNCDDSSLHEERRRTHGKTPIAKLQKSKFIKTT
jgi:hypothetical protein